MRPAVVERRDVIALPEAAPHGLDMLLREHLFLPGANPAVADEVKGGHRAEPDGEHDPAAFHDRFPKGLVMHGRSLTALRGRCRRGLGLEVGRDQKQTDDGKKEEVGVFELHGWMVEKVGRSRSGCLHYFGGASAFSRAAIFSSSARASGTCGDVAKSASSSSSAALARGRSSSPK